MIQIDAVKGRERVALVDDRDGSLALDVQTARLELAVHTGRIDRFKKLRPELAMDLDVCANDFPGENVDVGGSAHVVR